MRITLNGVSEDCAAATLAELLQSLDLANAAIATALNGSFIRRDQRAATPLHEGDAVEIVAPMQGG